MKNIYFEPIENSTFRITFSLSRLPVPAENRYMKRSLFVFSATAILLFSSVCNIFADAKFSESDSYEYNNIVSQLNEASAPQVLDEYVVFTQSSGPRFIGIAFDFEDYNVVHPYQLHSNRDLDGELINSVLFYLLPRPRELSSIKYRLIIDGLWTADPANPLKEYDGAHGLSLSRVDLGQPLADVTYEKAPDGVKFIYNGAPGETVRLAGTFTNWDSWIYELTETKTGFYELTVPLPKGKYYYNYYLGMNAVVDKSNPKRAYMPDGRTVSVIEVQ